MRLLLLLLCAAALLAAAGCGGGAGGTAAAPTDACGSPSAAQGGTAYPDLPDGPIVSSKGAGTSCAKLLALADEYAAGHVGTPFFRWLAEHGWTWLNADPTMFSRAEFDTDTYDIFVGSAPGEQSQVAFAAG